VEKKKIKAWFLRELKLVKKVKPRKRAQRKVLKRLPKRKERKVPPILSLFLSEGMKKLRARPLKVLAKKMKGRKREQRRALKRPLRRKVMKVSKVNCWEFPKSK